MKQNLIAWSHVEGISAQYIIRQIVVSWASQPKSVSPKAGSVICFRRLSSS